MADAAIDVRAVSKVYKIYARPRHRILEALGLGRYHTDFWALQDVTVQVERGSITGIIGVNGSGKSTLLQLVSGIVTPTHGRVTVNGRIASLLELGAGFSPEFTGRENVELYGTVMGWSRDALRRRLPEIAAFADIGDFIDRPMKLYSSGMYVRLAFAAAIHADPDVLLVDEALAVGDAVFQHQCLRRIKALQAEGRTILFVSHDMALIKALCSMAVVLHRGRVVKVGEPADVVNLYHAHVAEAERASAEKGATAGDAAIGFAADVEFSRRAGLFRHGTGAARIRTVELLDARGRRVTAVAFGGEATLRVHAEFHEDVPVSILGFLVRDRNGIDVVGTNTYEEGATIPPRRPGDCLVVDFQLELPLQPGSYSVTVALAYGPVQPAYLDWVDNSLVFHVRPPGLKQIHGKVGLPVRVSIHESRAQDGQVATPPRS
jgi:homopolymeric O-antigen transport system ATP-binding protein